MNKIISSEELKKTFISSIHKIGVEIFKNISQNSNYIPKTLEELEIDIQAEKKIFGGIQEKENKLNFLQFIGILIDVAKDLDENKKEYKINYDDVDFLRDENPFSNEKICSSYPSLIFFFAKNFDFYKQLKEKFYSFNPEEHVDHIPLWLLTLRVISSLNCVHFEPKLKFFDDSYLKEIKYILIKLLKINGSNLRDASWVNLALKVVPSQVQEPKIKYIYNFINTICAYGKDLPKLIKDGKKNIILEAIEQIFKYTFEQLLESKIYSQILQKNADLNESFFLKDLPIAMDAFEDFYKKEVEIDISNLGRNPEWKNTELYNKDILKGQKILLVMLWSSDLSQSESKFVTPDNLLKRTSVNSECVKTAVEFYGIEVEVVINYEDAINKITHQTKSGYCDYYAVWTFCGPDLPVLPLPYSKRDRNYKPDLLLKSFYLHEHHRF